MLKGNFHEQAKNYKNICLEEYLYQRILTCEKGNYTKNFDFTIAWNYRRVQVIVIGNRKLIANTLVFARLNFVLSAYRLICWKSSESSWKGLNKCDKISRSIWMVWSLILHAFVVSLRWMICWRCGTRTRLIIFIFWPGAISEDKEIDK